jgi:hypothetical protein
VDAAQRAHSLLPQRGRRSRIRGGDTAAHGDALVITRFDG